MDHAAVRTDSDAYTRYLAGMDASMRQKVALTAAHLLSSGSVADLGMGSGAGSAALAALYPALRVLGVDLDPTLVARARLEHPLPNLRFEVGDIARPSGAPGALDGVLASSVLHHLTSFGGYDDANAERAIAAQTTALREGGVLVVRDFLRPGPGLVRLELPEGDGDASDDPRSCSSAALFLRFSREFRSLSSAPGFRFEEERGPGVPAGRRRFLCEARHAAEFLLRKDYREDWVAEAKEEYGYATQGEFHAIFARLGLRVLASTPLCNPWIVANRLEGRCWLRGDDGRALDWPATNYVIVGEKVAPGEGVSFRDEGEAEPQNFLRLSHWRHVGSGAHRQLARRPGRALDVVPYFLHDGALFVLARASYPRPLGGSARASPPLDGVVAPGWVAEPFLAVQTELPLAETAVEALLAAGLQEASLRAVDQGTTLWPSPGGTEEEVTGVYVEIAPSFEETALPPATPFSTGGRLQPIEACQLLRSAQVGGLPDARLELHARALLARLGLDAGPWIGAALVIPAGPVVPQTPLRALLERPRRRAFQRAEASPAPHFLGVECRRFVELDAQGRPVARSDRELVLPRERSTNTLVTLPLLRRGQVVLAGIDDDDLPAAQCFSGSSAVLVAPAWRLPQDCTTLRDAEAFGRARLLQEYGVESGPLVELGGRWLPSAGLGPEVCLARAAPVAAVTAARRALSWVPLAELVRHAEALPEGHLRLASLRAAHALGLRA